MNAALGALARKTGLYGGQTGKEPIVGCPRYIGPPGIYVVIGAHAER